MTAKRLQGMPPPMPRNRAPASTPAPAIQEAIAQMSHVEYSDEATEIDGPHVAQKKWLDSIETIPFDPSMRVGTSDLGEGTPPRAVAPVRVQGTPRPTARRGQTPRPAPRPPARHPHDNAVTRLTHVDVAGGHVSFSPDPDQALPLPSIPTPVPRSMLHAPYGAPALPPHAPTAMALPPQAVMPTQIAQPLPLPTQPAHALPALVRPYQDGVTPYPVPPWATGQHGAALQQQSAVPSRGYAVPPNHLDIYADTDERRGETMRVSALPPSGVPSLRPSLTRYVVPMIGATALVVFVAGYFVVNGGTTTAAPTPVAAAAVMPVAKAPVVSEIVEPHLPAPSWKARAAEPTIVAANAEPIAEPVVEEIEMAPTPIAKPAKKSSSSSSARRAKRAQVAVIEQPKAKSARTAKIAKPAKAKKLDAPMKSTKASKSIAKSPRTERDPILEEIEKPAKSTAKATGPGKLAITTSVPTLIYVDGRSTNLMTPKTLNLSAGTHKITLLELKSRKAKTFDIEVASGTIAKLDKKF